MLLVKCDRCKYEISDVDHMFCEDCVNDLEEDLIKRDVELREARKEIERLEKIIEQLNKEL